MSGVIRHLLTWDHSMATHWGQANVLQTRRVIGRGEWVHFHSSAWETCPWESSSTQSTLRSCQPPPSPQDTEHWVQGPCSQLDRWDRGQAILMRSWLIISCLTLFDSNGCILVMCPNLYFFIKLQWNVSNMGRSPMCAVKPSHWPLCTLHSAQQITSTHLWYPCIKANVKEELSVWAGLKEKKNSIKGKMWKQQSVSKIVA